jgi:hypothetical protein
MLEGALASIEPTPSNDPGGELVVAAAYVDPSIVVTWAPREAMKDMQTSRPTRDNRGYRA